MFYRPEEGHGLPHDPFKAIVAPRPIGWISTRDADGRNNLAPYSFFNGIADNPPMVMFCSMGPKPNSGEAKDSIAIIRETGRFGVNVVSQALAEQMNLTAAHYERGVDEFERAGLEVMEGRVLDLPLVAAAPVALECELWREIDLPGSAVMITGTVRAVHIRDAFLRDGRLDVTAYRPLSRLGYMDYAAVDEVFAMPRPDDLV